MCLPMKTCRDFLWSTLQGQVQTPLGTVTLGCPIFPGSSLTFCCSMGFGFFFKHRIYCLKPYLWVQSEGPTVTVPSVTSRLPLRWWGAPNEAQVRPGALPSSHTIQSLSAWVRFPHALLLAISTPAFSLHFLSFPPPGYAKKIPCKKGLCIK